MTGGELLDSLGKLSSLSSRAKSRDLAHQDGAFSNQSVPLTLHERFFAPPTMTTILFDPSPCLHFLS